MKAKTKSCQGKINKNFHDNGMPKEGCYFYFSVSNSDSLSSDS